MNMNKARVIVSDYEGEVARMMSFQLGEVSWIHADTTIREDVIARCNESRYDLLILDWERKPLEKYDRDLALIREALPHQKIGMVTIHNPANDYQKCMDTYGISFIVMQTSAKHETPETRKQLYKSLITEIHKVLVGSHVII